uniref:Uncharacterized protein n=1 Tax=Globisporangium ultimum (strain ATCC 200006 / CBS 805.95 / DAOM BR144) TaxID=431595 RepID=K3WS02_GLOUD
MATDYEEKYLSLRDENTALKKKKNEQEATIKRMYTKLAIIEEALKKKRHAEESDNQEDPETGGKAGIPVKRDVETEKFITALKQENLALRKKTQSLKEKNRALEEKLRMAKLKPHSLRPAALAPTHAAAAAGAPKAKRSSNQDTLKAQHTFQGLTLDKQVENARKLHREAFSSELEQALKGRLVVAEKQLVKLQHENETLRSQGNTRGRSKTDNNDGTGSSDDDLDGKHGERRSTVSGIEVEQLRRELRDRQAQLAIMNARYDNLELNVAAEREIQEKTLDQMETMNRQVHKLRTQLQDATLEKDHLEARAAKASELEKELLLIRDQNRRLEERMTTLCESPFINDAFQRKERIDKLFDLEKLTEQQKFSINHMTDENQKLQVIIKELQNNLKVMKQAKDSLEQEMAKVKQSLNEERNARSAAAVRATNEIAASATPRELIPRPQPVSITIPTETEKRDACSSPLRVEQPLPMASQLSK